MGNVIDMRGNPMSLDTDLGSELVEDLSRFAEGLLTEAAVKKKYRFATEDWERLGQNDGLVERIEARKLQRIRGGQTKRELAQKAVIKAPEVLSGILLDGSQNARHRIDSAKALNDFATGGSPENPAKSDRFIIQINLGAGPDGKEIIEHYDKPLAPGPSDEVDNDPWA